MNQHRWNVPLADAPSACDVLVVGAGPAGSACAHQLALAGWSVVLADTRTFPRDKVCGDALVPDSIAALRRLGLLDRVLAQGRGVEQARCVAPNSQAVEVPGALAVVPRRMLDEILCRAAVEAGAVLVAPATFVSPRVDDGGRTVGAMLKSADQVREISARWVVLATGAAVTPLIAANVCDRKAASGVAVRQYIRHEGVASQLAGLRFVWHGSLRGGYGWIFPGPDGVCNIGVAVIADAGRANGRDAGEREGPRLREMFAKFAAIDSVAAQLVAEGVPQGPLKGAPFRCNLSGASWSRPGLLVTGEAAGSTYAFTGEGIGKALESGMAAADSLIEANARIPAATPSAQADSDREVELAYEARLQSLQPRFEMYRRASIFYRYPWLLSFLVWRARNNPRAIAALADILAERRMPGSPLSWRGLKAICRL